MNTAYRTRIASPFRVARKPQFPPIEKTDTLRNEVGKLLGTYQFSATFEVDNQTTETLKHIPGLVAFLCTLRLGDRVIGQGRGTTAINQINKFIVRNICFAFNGSLVDAIVRSTKILDVFRPDNIPHPWTSANAVKPTGVEQYDSDSGGITDKQKSYLLQLIQTNVADEDDREQQISQLDEMSRDEASEAIQSFKN